MLRSDLCDCSDAYITVKGRITAIDTNNVNTRNKMLTFKNNVPLCISQINNTFIDNAEDLNIAMSIL